MPKKVCIVGAGPSGLAAAKSLLRDVPKGTFDVTIFEAQPRIGGLWPSERTDGAGLVHPLMVANQSKHTMQFSDLAWEHDAAQFPRAWQVGRYLKRYLNAYCQEAKLNLGTRVEKVELIKDQAPGWRVRSRSSDGCVVEQTFDHLLVSSGYFGKPVIPTLTSNSTAVPVVHSSRYRDLPTLLGGAGSNGGKILVVGGQMSGVEIAGTIATHLSSAVNSPGQSSITNPDKYKIQHLMQRPVWVFPLHTSPTPTSSAPTFLPLDLSSYNLANRPKPLTNTQGHISVELARTVHAIYRNVVGTDQSIFSPDVAVKAEETVNPPYLAVSDHYLDFVRSGLISVTYGKLDSLSDRTATISPSMDTIGDIAAIVLATGFQASDSISYLPESIQKDISVSPGDLNNTVALAFHGTYHPNVPNLGFVGFYRSPYWGVMEMQARFISALWAAGGPASVSLPQSIKDALESDTSIERTVALRADARSSQFPMGDYPWLMQEFAKSLGLERSPISQEMPRLPPSQLPMDILTPSRYPVKNPGEFQLSENLKSLNQTRDTVLAGFFLEKFTARAVFRSLLGEWKLERDLVSQLPSHPSGHFSGIAKFLLREGTRDGRETEFDKIGEGDDPVTEYLYVEEGDFKASNGLTFRATRRYVWRYDEDNDRLSVWFVKTDDPKKADYLFHNVEFSKPGEEDDCKGWRATAGHLCIDDFYDVNYEFCFAAINLKDWRLRYTVKGPKKNYTIDGTYRR